jgi:hypothetical protein
MIVLMCEHMALAESSKSRAHNDNPPITDIAGYFSDCHLHKPTVLVDRLDVDTGDKNLIRERLEKNRESLLKCYKRAIRKDFKLHGKMTIQVNPSERQEQTGSTAQLIETTIGWPPLQFCVSNVLKRLKLPATAKYRTEILFTCIY